MLIYRVSSSTLYPVCINILIYCRIGRALCTTYSENSVAETELFTTLINHSARQYKGGRLSRQVCWFRMHVIAKWNSTAAQAATPYRHHLILFMTPIGFSWASDLNYPASSSTSAFDRCSSRWKQLGSCSPSSAKFTRPCGIARHPTVDSKSSFYGLFRKRKDMRRCVAEKLRNGSGACAVEFCIVKWVRVKHSVEGQNNFIMFQ